MNKELLIEEKLNTIEKRLDQVDKFYDVIIRNFMALEDSEFKCSLCKELNLSALCNTCENKEKH